MEEGEVLEEHLVAATFTVEDAINECGFGWFQVKATLFAGLVLTVASVIIFLLVIVSPEVRCEFSFSALEECFITTVAFCGMICGSPIWGSLSDKYGRKKSLILCMVALFLATLFSCFAKNYAYLLVSWGLIGLSVSGTPMATPFYSELLPAKHRPACFMFVHVFNAIGIFFEVGVAILFTHFKLKWKLKWYWLNGVATVVVGLSLLLFLLVPESPYYLLTSGKAAKATEVLAKVAKNNGKMLPVGRLVLQQDKNGGDDDDDDSDVEGNQLIAIKPRPEKVRRGTFRDLFATSQQTVTTVLLCVIWMCSTFGYFGIVLLTTEILDLFDVLHAENKSDGTLWPCGVDAADFRNVTLGGQCEMLTMNDYFQFLWTSAAELPGLLLTVFLAKVMGRKKLLAVEFIASGLPIFLLFICPLNKYLMMLIVFVVRSLITGALQAVYMYTPEVYPTAIRSLGVGFCNAVGRCGALISPFVAQVFIIRTVHGAEAVYGGMCILAGICAIFLPIETKNRELKDVLAPKTEEKRLIIN
ncbi:synaptic vesicle 2-related protein-like [Oscarella lobularis]|uniref:synaptic vesicle 2-related protein-like n=1 Tax=Oscarella lobularis TaxID=121494 RepID=UPI00331342C6